MTLQEMAVNYRAEEARLKARIGMVRAKPVETRSEMLSKADRLRILEAMRRDVRDMAVICERYYQTGYRMCQKYSINY